MASAISDFTAPDRQLRHSVLLYSNEGSLCRSVAEFVVEGVRNGEPAVLITTAEHRRGISERIKDSDATTDQVLWFDAQAMLESMLRGPTVNVEQLRTQLDDHLQRFLVLENRPGVRFYGELVDLLCQRGDFEGALRVESTWNRALARHAERSYLLCSCASRSFFEPARAATLRDLFLQHTHVCPDELVSVRERTQPQGEDAAALLRAVLDSSADAIVSTDAQGTIKLANPAVEAMFDYGPQELVGRPLASLVSVAERQESRALLEACLAAGTRAVLCARKDGSSFTAELRVRAHRSASGEGYAATIRDTTEGLRSARIFAAQELRLRTAIAYELHDSVGQLLTGGRLLANSLVRDVPEALQPRMAFIHEILADAIEKVRATSRDLAMSQVGESPLSDALRALVERTRMLFNIACRFEPHDSFSDPPPFQRQQVFLVVQEALTNAARHSGCSSAWVSLALEGAWYVLRVRDDGNGTAAAHSGAGLGVAGMHHRAQLLGGSLEVDSVPQRGTEVILRWPRM